MRTIIAAALALTTAGLAKAEAPAPAQDAAPQKIYCRSTAQIGSLVKRHKTCLTKEQWKYVREQNEKFARQMLQDGSGRPGCSILDPSNPLQPHGDTC